ncbi:MAG: transporter substrate-binding domain-containing protein [Mameliella sp.]|nr:transporter substrate-binding domain-containing protein [Phaeodactylibacter sp.]
MRYLLFLFFLPFIWGQANAQNDATVLKVAVYDAPPFGLRYPDSTYGRLMVELWEDLADDLDFSYSYTLTDMNTLLTGLQEGTFDVGLGAISITPKREALVDFTQPVNPSGTGIATAATSRRNVFANYWKPILVNLLKLIGTLLLVLLISGTIVWLAERRFSKDNPSDRNIQGLADGLWWSAVTMTTVGYGDKVPNSQIGKVLGIVWIFTSIILLSLFTANASAILTTTRLSSHIQSEDQLRQAKVGAAQKSSGEEYLIREHVEYTAFPSTEEAIAALIEGEIDAVVSNIPVLKYFNNNREYYQQLAISPRLLLKNNMGIALPDDSPLREPIDQLLLEKIAEPKWQKAVYRYLGED